MCALPVWIVRVFLHGPSVCFLPCPRPAIVHNHVPRAFPINLPLCLPPLATILLSRPLTRRAMLHGHHAAAGPAALGRPRAGDGARADVGVSRRCPAHLGQRWCLFCVLRATGCLDADICFDDRNPHNNHRSNAAATIRPSTRRRPDQAQTRGDGPQSPRGRASAASAILWRRVTFSGASKGDGWWW